MMSFCSNKDARHFCAGTHSVCALTSIQQESNRQNFHDLSTVLCLWCGCDVSVYCNATHQLVECKVEDLSLSEETFG